MSEVIRNDRSKAEVEPVSLARLGGGKAAQVHKVRDTATGELYAEKRFETRRNLSQLFRNLIYWLCFQAPFPYGTRRNAVKAALFRRKVLRDLTEFWSGTPQVADAHYTRWDDEARAFVLGTEYIEGYGPKPGQFNPRALRNLVLNYPVRLCKILIGHRTEKVKGPPWEIDKAAKKLDELKARFHQAGFIGSEWQVDKALSITTSNLLKDGKSRWILVDTESGMPALALSKYLWAAIRYGSVPLFDDTDFNKLHRYLSDNQDELVAWLGETRAQMLQHNVERLQYHTMAWKSSEPAIFSHRHHILTDSRLRSCIRRGFVEHWYRKGRIPAEKAKLLRNSNLRFTWYLSLDISRSIFSGAGIIIRSAISFGIRIANYLFLALRFLYVAIFREAELRQIAETYINGEINSWHKAGRLTDAEAKELRQDMDSPAVLEYTKGFMVHIGLKLLEPPFVGNVLIALLAIILETPHLLALLFIEPAMRTIYTLYRALRNRGKGISYRNALLVGALPKVGVLAYCIQMSTIHPNLSRFLIHCQAAKFSCHIPLFGGTNSRLEHFTLKVTDMALCIQHELTHITRGFSLPRLPNHRAGLGTAHHIAKSRGK